MSREDDKKIAEWAKATPFSFETAGMRDIYTYGLGRHYTTSDADAITLLPVLVEKEREAYYLISRFDGANYVWALMTWYVVVLDKPTSIPDAGFHPTISAAITTAVLALIAQGESGE